MGPSSKNKKGASINDTILPGNAHLQPITTNLLKAHFTVVHTTGDISNFYLQSGLNIQNSLNSAIYLQEPDIGTIYPTLALTDIYEKYFPNCKNKQGKVDLSKVAQILKDSYVDDTSIEAMLHNLMEELLNPTFSHEDIPSWCCL